MQLTIRARLSLLIALMLILMAALGINSYRELSSAESQIGQVVHASSVLRNHMEGDMMHDALRADVLAALLAESPSDWQAVTTNVADHSKHFREMISANNEIAPSSIKSELTALSPVLDRYISNAEALVATAQRDKAQAKAMLPQFLATFEELEERLAQVSDHVQDLAASAEKDARDTIASAKIVDLAVVISAAMVALVVATLLVRAIRGGIANLATVLTRMARGELGRGIAITSNDEFGELLTSVQSMDRKLSEIVSSVQTSAQSVGSAAHELSRDNEDLSERTHDQAAALEEAAASMEQMAASVRKNAENARAANQLAIGARNQADRGGAILRNAVTAMGEINSSSDKIADIIGVIDEIAFQTNLLALNAAVEAARAGEQGRGFAVVATEVRHLAQRSAGAAKEIKGLITESIDKVKVGAKLVDDSGRAIAEIIASAKQVTDIVGEISGATDEQASGIEQVNRAVAGMDASTQQNATLVEKTAAAGKAMESQTQRLIAEVGFFKTNAPVHMPSSIAATALDHSSVSQSEALRAA